MTNKERTYQKFMERLDKDEYVGDPFVGCIKMMVSALIAKDGFRTALETLCLGFGSNNIVIYSQNMKAIACYKKYPAQLTNIIKAHVKNHNKEEEFYEEFDKTFAGKKRNVIIYSVQTDKHIFYIVILDNDIIDKELKNDTIDASKIAFYTIFDNYELVRQLKANSDIDALTGAKSRFVYQRVSRKLTQFAPDITFVVCDLLSLKRINDKFGHPIGDIYLKNAVKYMEKQFPNCVYKLGGDEFVIIAPGKQDVDKKMEAANAELKKTMKHSVRKAGEVYYINYGYTYGKTAEISAEMFYKTADDKLTEDKRQYYSKNNTAERRTR